MQEIWLNLVTEENLSAKFTIGAKYRHPNDKSNHIEVFSEALCNTINKITKCNGNFYLLGDINIDRNISERSMGSSLYPEHLTTYSSLPIITIPTRVTENSSTIIDHNYNKINDYARIMSPIVIRCDYELSDHYVVFWTTNNYPTKSRKQLFITIREKSNFKANAYCEEMVDRLTSSDVKLTNLDVLTVQNNDLVFVLSSAPLKPLIRIDVNLKRTFRNWLAELQLDFM